MDRGPIPPLRSLPRLFLPGASMDQELISLPDAEVKKLRHVLRLSSGAQIAILPNDGTIIRCTLQGHEAVPVEQVPAGLPPKRRVILAQAIPKPEKLEEVVRMGTEMGVAGFVVFPSERTVVKWDEKKRLDRLRRLESIAREAAEVCFRGTLPELKFASSLKEVLERFPDAVVLSESDRETKTLQSAISGRDEVTLVVGPEGGWAPSEMKLIGDQGITLGPLVLRVDTAAAAACAITLLGR